MIRQAKALDYWRGVQKNESYEFTIQEIDFKGIYGLEKVNIRKGIYAICGLNGAGKSTVISFLKDIIGIELNEFDKKKIANNIVESKVEKFSDRLVVNIDGKRLKDCVGRDKLGNYIDYKGAEKVLGLLSQDNIEEFLEQFDENELGKEHVDELSYLVGKSYEEIKITIIEDDDVSIPYYKVKCGGVMYDSTAMGIGEHFLFYVHWILTEIKNTDIAIIEEPETFISIPSQKHLMNFIAKKAVEESLVTILTTHSPYIIENISTENICIVSKHRSKTSVTYPKSRDEVLNKLGLISKKKGILYFEDQVALSFFKYLTRKFGVNPAVRRFDFEVLKGEGEIKNRLKFPKTSNFSYKIIGIFDGDMKIKEDSIKNCVNWEFDFLPCNIGVEEKFSQICKNKVEDLADLLRLSEDDLISAFSMVDGKESHDWLLDLAKELGFDINEIVAYLSEMWISSEEQNYKECEFFINRFIHRFCMN